jgi:prolipoprotein diacylglyceryltransferase
VQISTIPPSGLHALFEALAYAAAGALYADLRRRRGDVIGSEDRLSVLVGAALGAAFGSRLLFWLCEPAEMISRWREPAYWLSGKTIVGGLLGGWIGVEWMKKRIGVTKSTGDLFVPPLIAGIAVGRVGCFLAGPSDHTAGDPTVLPWGIAVEDGIARHPVAVYEILFLLSLLPALKILGRRFGAPGDQFRLFLFFYLVFRFFVDFLKPEPPPIAFGLTTIQIACAAGAVWCSQLLRRGSLTAVAPA